MADLYELLAPYFGPPTSPSSSSSSLPLPPANDPQTTTYLKRLSTLSLPDLASTEPALLLHALQSHLRNLQALSKRSHKAVIASSSHLANLTSLLSVLDKQAKELRDEVPELETEATVFAHKYDRSTENAVLDRRKRALLLNRNVDRVSDVLELPSLLSSTVAAAQAPGATGSAARATTSYASASDLHAYIMRLDALYPRSQLVGGILKQAGAEMENLTGILISSLQSPSLKLAAAMRTIGWLRRVAPDLADDKFTSSSSKSAGATSMKSLNPSSSSTAAATADGALGSLFLVCRLRTLNNTLQALDPLRELADLESAARRKQRTANGDSKTMTKQTAQTSGTGALLGSQSERYLKRYLEIFREQSFAIVSMYKSIFPSGLPTPSDPSTTGTDLRSTPAGHDDDDKRTNDLPTPSDPNTTGTDLRSTPAGRDDDDKRTNDPLLPLPSPLATFALHLVDILTTMLREYMPNIADKGARESLLTQVLYCAGSLGRLGGEFGLLIVDLTEDIAEEDGEDEAVDGEVARDVVEGREEGDGFDGEERKEEDLEWVQVMKKHRQQASRLEVLARGVGGGGGGGMSKSSGSMDVISPSALSAG